MATENNKINMFLTRLYEQFSAVYLLYTQTDSYEELLTDDFLQTRIASAGSFTELYAQLFGSVLSDNIVLHPTADDTRIFHNANHSGLILLSSDAAQAYDYRILKLSDSESALILLAHSVASDARTGMDKELEKINTSKNMLISNMSHEIRTPINAVLGMNEMILRETDDPQLLSYATEIRNSGRMVLSIINDILDFSMIETGKIAIIPAQYQIATLLTDLCTMISGQIKGAGLSFVTDIDPHIPSVLIGDELRIKQVVLNLLTNAVKYTKHGTITLSVHYFSTKAGHPALKFSVRDTGIGIQQDTLQHLLCAYDYVGEKNSLHIEGTGLGLNIVVRLLKQMNSKLEIESELGQGSVFSFLLPQQVVRNTPIDPFIIESYSTPKPSGSNTLYAPTARVLAVDDNLVNLTVFKGLLKKTGIVPDCAKSGAECLQQLKKKNYDIIFLDHLMPEMDGIETLDRIRQMEGINCTIPIIALTANVMYGARERYLAAGFTDFLEKPLQAEALEKILSTYLPIECLETRKD